MTDCFFVVYVHLN